MKTIFLFIPPSLISDLLRTVYLRYAAEKFRVVVFTKNIDNETGQREYLASPNVTYVKWKPKNSRLLGRFKFFRIDGIHQFNHLRGVQQYFQKQMFLKDKRARLIRALTRPFGKFLTVDVFTFIEKLLIRVPKEFKELCKEHSPLMTVVSTPGMSVLEAEAILMSKKMGIPTAAVNFNWDNLTLQKAHLMRRCDYLLVWNDVIRDQAIDIHHYDPDKVLVTGVIRFDHYFTDREDESGREEFLKAKNLNPDLPTILFITESRSYSFQLKWLRNLFDLRAQKKIPYTNIFIRIHPNDIQESYREFQSQPNTRIESAGQPMINQVDRVEMRERDLLNQKLTLKHTDLNFNYCSTMSLESMAFDKPVITFFEPGHYDTEKTHYKPLIDQGAVKLVYNLNELAETIGKYLQNPALDSEKRKAALDRYIPFRDGRSPYRSVDALYKLICD